MVDDILRAKGAIETTNDPTENWTEMLDSMEASGVDVSQPLPVTVQIIFPSSAAMRQGGAELLVAGYPGVRVGDGQLPNLYVLMQIVLTVEALSAIRNNLESFAAARGGYVADDAEGGDQVIGRYQWRGRLDQQLSADQWLAVDEGVANAAMAWDVDPRVSALVTPGIGFGDEATARRAGGELFAAGWPEIHIARGESAWVVEVPMSMVPKPEEVRNLRESLSSFATTRAGAFLDLHVLFAAPKQVLEQS